MESTLRSRIRRHDADSLLPKSAVLLWHVDGARLNRALAPHCCACVRASPRRHARARPRAARQAAQRDRRCNLRHESERPPRSEAHFTDLPKPANQCIGRADRWPGLPRDSRRDSRRATETADSAHRKSADTCRRFQPHSVISILPHQLPSGAGRDILITIVCRAWKRALRCQGASIEQRASRRARAVAPPSGRTRGTNAR